MLGWRSYFLLLFPVSLTPPFSPPERSVSSGAYPRPRPTAWAPTWSPRCASTTGSPTAARRRPSGRSWRWTPTTRRRTASTPCCRTPRRTTRTAAHRHLPVRSAPTAAAAIVLQGTPTRCTLDTVGSDRAEIDAEINGG